MLFVQVFKWSSLLITLFPLISLYSFFVFNTLFVFSILINRNVYVHAIVLHLTVLVIGLNPLWIYKLPSSDVHLNSSYLGHRREHPLSYFMLSVDIHRYLYYHFSVLIFNVYASIFVLFFMNTHFHYILKRKYLYLKEKTWAHFVKSLPPHVKKKNSKN